MKFLMTDSEWLDVLAGDKSCVGSPKLPADDIQVSTVGRSGRRVVADAFLFKNFLKTMLGTYSTVKLADARILDFGCGWGRILRTFLNEAPAANLLGLDAEHLMVEIAVETTGNGVAYRKIEQLPPTGLPERQFDLIYAYSVFSHLSEPAAASWIAEFSRVAKPGGLICVTTRPRTHLTQFLENQPVRDVTIHSDMYRKIFGDPESDLARYDRGEFVFQPGSNRGPSAEHYGEAVVPEAYARKNWTSDRLEFVGYFERYAPSYLQPAIVLRRNGVI